MALGAQRGDITAWITRVGGTPVLAGLFIGFSAAFAFTRYLGSPLYGVKATDPVTFAVVTFVMIAVAAIAMMLPARRALRVDPMTALRSE